MSKAVASEIGNNYIILSNKYNVCLKILKKLKKVQ